MKSFKQFLKESWKKYRQRQAYQRRDTRRGVPFLSDPDIDTDLHPSTIMSAEIEDEDGEVFSIKPNLGIGYKRYDIGTQRDRGQNKRFYRLSQALERDGYSRDLSDKVDSAAGRLLGRIQFRGAKLRGITPGPGFDQFLTNDVKSSRGEPSEYDKNFEAFFDNKNHREIVGTSVSDLADTRDWYRFHKIHIHRHTNDRIQKFLDNLHRSGRIIKSTI